MFAEYKRDVSHNYLILHGDETINTTLISTDPDRKYNVFYIKMPHAGTGWNMALLL